MSNAKLFLIGNLGFLAGAAGRSFLHIPLFVSAALAVLSVGAIVLPRRAARAVGMALLAVGLGIIRFDLAVASLPTVPVGEVVRLTGVVVEEPVVRDRQQQVVVDSRGARFALTLRSFPKLVYADEIIFHGVLEPPRTNGGVDAIRSDRVVATARLPDVEIIGHDKGNAILAALFRVKSSFRQALGRALPQPESALASGLLLGTREDLPLELLDAFNRTGTTHIIALSGFNITIIATFMASIFRLLPFGRRPVFALTIIAVALFVLMTGASASVVRAAVMGCLVLLAKQVGRFSSGRHLLAFAATAMVIHNPFLLAFDRSFELSVAATAGLLFLAPRLREWFRWLPEMFSLRETVSATTSATLFTLPIMIGIFGRVSLVGLIANVLILPAIPFAMGLAFLAGLAGLVSPIASVLPSGAAWLTLTYIIRVVEMLAGLPFAALNFQ